MALLDQGLQHKEGDHGAANALKLGQTQPPDHQPVLPTAALSGLNSTSLALVDRNFSSVAPKLPLLTIDLGSRHLLQDEQVKRGWEPNPQSLELENVSRLIGGKSLDEGHDAQRISMRPRAASLTN